MNNGYYGGYGPNSNPYQNQNNYNNQIFIRPKTPIEIETEHLDHISKGHAKVLFYNLLAGSILMFIIMFLFAIVNMDFKNPQNYAESLSGIPVYTITALSTALGSIFTILMHFKGQKGWLKRLTTPEKSDWKNAIKPKNLVGLALLTLGGNYIFGILINLLETLLKKVDVDISTANMLDSFSSIKGIEKLSLVLLIVVFAPVFEEIIFRGIILTPLRRYGDKFAIVVSAMIFGLTHGNLQQMLPTFVIALVMGYVTVKSNSIIPAMVLHFINNLYALFASFVSIYFFPEGTEFTDVLLTGKILMIITYAVIIFSVVYTIVKVITRKRWISFENLEQIPEIYQPVKKKTIYFKNGAMLAYVIILGLIILLMLFQNVLLQVVSY